MKDKATSFQKGVIETFVVFIAVFFVVIDLVMAVKILRGK